MYDKEISSICPICNKAYSGIPAISRTDNMTLVCHDCGTRQSLESICTSPEEIEKIIQIIHQTYSRGDNING